MNIRTAIDFCVLHILMGVLICSYPDFEIGVDFICSSLSVLILVFLFRFSIDYPTDSWIDRLNQVMLNGFEFFIVFSWSFVFFKSLSYIVDPPYSDLFISFPLIIFILWSLKMLELSLEFVRNGSVKCVTFDKFYERLKK